MCKPGTGLATSDLLAVPVGWQVGIDDIAVTVSPSASNLDLTAPIAEPTRSLGDQIAALDTAALGPDGRFGRRCSFGVVVYESGSGHVLWGGARARRSRLARSDGWRDSELAADRACCTRGDFAVRGQRCAEVSGWV